MRWYPFFLCFLSRARSFSAECIHKGSKSVCVWNSCAMSRATSCTDHVAWCIQFWKYTWQIVHFNKMTPTFYHQAKPTKNQRHNSENFAPSKKQTPSFSTNKAWKTKFIQILHTGKEKRRITNKHTAKQRINFFWEQNLEWSDASFQEAQIVAIPRLQTLVRLEPATLQARIGGVSRIHCQIIIPVFLQTKINVCVRKNSEALDHLQCTLQRLAGWVDVTACACKLVATVKGQKPWEHDPLFSHDSFVQPKPGRDWEGDRRWRCFLGRWQCLKVR